MANIPLRRASPRASSELPGDSTGPVYAPAALALGARGATRRRDRLPIRSCTRWGLPCHGGHPSCGALLPHRFTLATRASRRRSAVCSLLHCPAGHPDRSLTGTSPCGARTFLGDPDKADRRSRRPSGLRKTKHSTNSLAHRTTWLRSDFSALCCTVLRVTPSGR